MRACDPRANAGFSLPKCTRIAQPVSGFCVVLRHPAADLIHEAQNHLCLRITALG